jgi:hypothetical protein
VEHFFINNLKILYYFLNNYGIKSGSEYDIKVLALHELFFDGNGGFLGIHFFQLEILEQVKTIKIRKLKIKLSKLH